MMITPPDELLVYISTNVDGEWIHDPNMPIELEETFQRFVKEEAAFRELQKG